MQVHALTDAEASTKSASRFTKRFFQTTSGAVDKRRDIEGMRAVAVLMVLLFHAGVELPGGFAGVDVFFVISGFIITGSLLSELEARNSISIIGFYARRAKRLLPATALVLVATALLTIAFLPRTRWSSVATDIYASVFYSMNWRLFGLSTDYTAQDQAASPLQHFWSLAVEEQFYFVWPALLLAATWIPRRRRSAAMGGHEPRYALWLLAAMAVVTLPSLWYSISYSFISPNEAYFSTFTRLWELAIGGGVAIVAPVLLRLPRGLAALLSWAGLAAVAASCFVLSSATVFPGYAALLPVLGTAALIAGTPAAGTWGCGGLLSRPVMVAIGGLSYSLYLWHWPLLVAAEASLGSLNWRIGLPVIALAGVCAWLSKVLLEDRARNSATFVRSSARSLQLGFACMVFGVVSAVGLQATLWPPTPSVYRAAVSLSEKGSQRSSASDDSAPGARLLAKRPYGDKRGAPSSTVGNFKPAAEVASKDVVGAECVVGTEVTSASPCEFGDPSGAETIALIGDSHAGQWLLPMDAIAKDRGMRLTVHTKQNCRFAQGLIVEYEERPYPECTAWVDDVIDELKKARPSMAVISAAYLPGATYYSESGAALAPDVGSAEALAAYERTLRTLVELGIEVFVLADTPRPGLAGIEPTECASSNARDLSACSFSRAAALTNRGLLEQAAALVRDVKLLDLSYAICPTEQCAVVIGGVLIYRDANHLTATYAATLAPRLDALLEP